LKLKNRLLPFSFVAGLCLPMVGFAEPGPLDPSMNPSVTVEYGGSTYSISRVVTSYNDNPDLLTSQPWWGNPSLASGLSQAVADAENVSVRLVFAYSIKDGSISIFWEEAPGSVVDCPTGCPSLDLYDDYAILNELITQASMANSLQSTSQGFSSLNSGLNMMINGAHSRPLSRMVAPGKSTFWAAGDWGTDEHGQRSGSAGLAEVGVGHNYGSFQFNASLGQTWARQNLSSNGRAESDGQYLLVEGIVPVSAEQNLFATLGAFGHWGEIDMRRGYISASALDSSKGNADSQTWGLRARLDWVDALSLGNTGISPYADLSYTHSKLDGYTEKGGANPASFDSRTDRYTEARLGFGTETPLSWWSGYNLVANLEAAHRFEDRSAGVSGNVNGLFTFNLPGEDYQNDWLKAGVGIEGLLGDGKASLMLNGTTDSDQPDMWVAASYQLSF
tara:strand:+ start:36471 stop:37811 length:1341 start_codon:yes stop_codon:yes gene_type:complete